MPAEIANHTVGSYRSRIAKKTFENSKDFEKKYYEYLVENFKEIAVHEHKLIRPGDVSCDFFIYMSENVGVVIDIFYAVSIINLVNVVNIKLKRYGLIEPETYLVIVGNDDITQAGIDEKVRNRRVALPKHININTDSNFRNNVVPELRKRSMYSLFR